MAMPWERVEKPYRFEGPSGALSLVDLFDGRSQLIVYHFMLGPDWAEGCKSCSFWADNFNGIPVHLNHRDVTFTAVSRAPLAKISAYKKRMGWSFPWVSSHGSDFNFDYHVSFAPGEVAEGKAYYNYEVRPIGASDEQGISIFYKDEGGEVFHTYSCHGRGIDMVNGAYHFLELVPKGRDEDGLEFSMEWVRRHDQYWNLDLAAANGISTSPRSTGTKRMCEDSRGSATMIANQRETAGKRAGSGNAAALGAADRLCLAAAPTFAIMALLTGVLADGPPDPLCSAAQDASPLSGMVPMYLLMSAFHSAPWLKLVSSRRSGARRS